MSKRTLQKVSKKATLDVDIDNKSSRRFKSKVKRLSPKVLALCLVFLLVGAGIGFFALKLVTKNDRFELIGNDVVTLELNKDYVDPGVKAVAFNKDCSKDVKIKTNLKTRADGKFYAEEEGTYYIIYTVDNFKYGSIFKIQKIRFVDYVLAGELENAGNDIGGANA